MLIRPFRDRRSRKLMRLMLNAVKKMSWLALVLIDRRRTTSSHTDPRVAAIGFRRREDNAYAAVIVNYPMHPVALGASNRHISADIPGQAALALAGQIPGHPVVLVTNGACGNLNPPAENVAFAQIQAWGGQIADAVAPLLNRADPVPSAKLRVATRVLPLPLDVLTVEGIEATAAKALKNPGPIAEWGDKYRRAVEHWRRSLIAEIDRRRPQGGRIQESNVMAPLHDSFDTADGEIFKATSAPKRGAAWTWVDFRGLPWTSVDRF